jgi:hypothetical protein
VGVTGKEEGEDRVNYINQRNAFCGQNGKLINVKTDGTFRIHLALKEF